MKSGDSRSTQGLVLPLQAHGNAYQDGKVGGRPSVLAFRQMDANDWGVPVEDQRAMGDVSGFHVWMPKGESMVKKGPRGEQAITMNLYGKSHKKKKGSNSNWLLWGDFFQQEEMIPNEALTGYFTGAANALNPNLAGFSFGAKESDSTRSNQPDPGGGLNTPPKSKIALKSLFVTQSEGPAGEIPEGTRTPFGDDDSPSGGPIGGIGEGTRPPSDDVTAPPPDSGGTTPPTPPPVVVTTPGAEPNGPRSIPTWRECRPVIRSGGTTTPSGGSGGSGSGGSETPGGGSDTGSTRGYIFAAVSSAWLAANASLVSKYGVNPYPGGGSSNVPGTDPNVNWVVVQLPLELAKLIPTRFYATPPDFTSDVQWVNNNDYGQTTTPGSGSMGNGDLGPQSPTVQDEGPETVVLPTVGYTFDPDFNMEPVNLGTTLTQPYMPRYLEGTFGIAANTNDVGKQVLQFLPTDPRLVAVNRDAGNVSCGTLVYEANTGRYDMGRSARLQSAFRVIRSPSGSLIGGDSGSTSASAGGATPNVLALQLGISGAGDCLGGMVADGRTGGVGTRLGMLSVRYGGPLDVGRSNDPHKLGTDADGNPINPVHISTLAFFANGASEDGPIDFETPWKATTETTYIHKVHWMFDRSAGYSWPRDSKSMNSNVGKWKLWGSHVVSVATPPTPRPPTTPSGPPTFTPPYNPNPTTPSGTDAPHRPETMYVSGAVDPTFGYIRRYSSTNLSSERQPAVMVAELAGPGILARPQRFVEMQPDLRYVQGFGNARAVAEQETYAPITLRVLAFGGQGGKVGGPYLTNPLSGTQQGQQHGYVYTQQPGRSRHKATGPGGFVMVPPEIDLSDIDDGLAPTGVPLSTSYFVAAPGVYFGAGLPELATGGLKSGWSWGSNGTELLWRTHNSSGTPSTYLTFRVASNDMVLNDGLAIVVGTSSGTRIATSAGQKFAFHGASPVAQDTGWVAGAHTVRRTLSTGDTLAQTQDYLITIVEKILLSKGLAGA